MCGCPYDRMCNCYDNCIWYMEMKYKDHPKDRTAYESEKLGYEFVNGSDEERHDDIEWHNNQIK